MRLSCQKALLMVLISSVGCHEVTSPVAVTAFYMLITIDGRALPTFLSPIPESPTVLSSSLTLDNAGKAVIVEHRQDMFQGDTTFRNTYDYTINGNEIVIGSSQACPPGAICAASFVGTISNGHLSLVINPASINGRIVYDYLHIGPVD
jgi:hypothetical protein